MAVTVTDRVSRSWCCTQRMDGATSKLSIQITLVLSSVRERWLQLAEPLLAASPSPASTRSDVGPVRDGVLRAATRLRQRHREERIQLAG